MMANKGGRSPPAARHSRPPRTVLSLEDQSPQERQRVRKNVRGSRGYDDEEGNFVITDVEPNLHLLTPLYFYFFFLSFFRRLLL